MKVSCVMLSWVLLAGAQTDEDWGKLVKTVKYSLSEAVDKAVKESGEGFAFHAELELDKGELVYSIDISQGESSTNVVLDVEDGSVVEKDSEGADFSKESKACKVSLKHAIAAASKSAAGTPIEAELIMKNEKPTIDVKIFDGKVKKRTVDGITGEVQDSAKGREGKFTETFGEDPADLVSKGSNPYFILQPGYTLTLEGKEGNESVQLIITVLDETKKVDGVDTRIVEERESADGELVEVSRNFFAISKRTNNVYYFGEEVDMYKDGKIVGHGGAWVSGENKAHYGLMMAGTPLIGSRYYQEVAPEVALDRAEIVSMSETLETKAGNFENVLKIEETTPLEKGTSYKFYAAGVGLIRDDHLKLVKVRK